MVLCKTSNPGAGEFQNRRIILEHEDVAELEELGHYDVIDVDTMLSLKLYEFVALRVSRTWNTHGNCGLETSATYPENIARVRRIVGSKFPLLITAGIDSQGCNLEAAVRAATGCNNQWFIVNSSRDLVQVARERIVALNDRINGILASKRDPS